ncbi:MAG: hypothetical protein Q8Q10_01115, partial [bacterium]|nr:hypothetical protein [bacterium]
MFTSIAQLKEFCQRHLVVVALVALMVVEALSLAVLVQPSLPSGILMPSQSVQESVVAEPIQKISEIKGQQIDDEAAMIVVEGSSPAPACATLPIGIWVFLLIA